MALSDFGSILSVGTICFEDRFFVSKKGGKGGGVWVLARSVMHMAAALHGCRMALLLKLAGPFLILLALSLTS